MKMQSSLNTDDLTSVIEGLKLTWGVLPNDSLYQQMSKVFYDAEATLSADDRELCKRLDEEDTETYARLVTNLREAVDVVQDYVDRHGERIFRLKTIIPHVAKVAAWHKFVTDFVSSHS